MIRKIGCRFSEKTMLPPRIKERVAAPNSHRAPMKIRAIAAIGKCRVLVVRSSRLRQLTILVVAALTTFTAPSPDDWPNPRRARRKIRVPGARRRTLSLSRRTARLGGGGRAAAPSVCRRAPGQQPHGRSRPMGESVFSQRHAGGQHLLRDFGIFAVDPLSG